MYMRLSRCSGVGNRPPGKKKLQIPGSVPEGVGAWLQVKLNHALFLYIRGSIKVLNRRATEFDTQAKNWQGPEGLVP